MPDALRVTVDGQVRQVVPGTTVAAAAMEANGGVLRRSVAGQPRGPICGMGVCFECRVTIDGTPHRRSCLVPCRDGMEIRTDA